MIFITFYSCFSLGHLGFYEFYVCAANSRAALIPSNIHWKFSVRLFRFTLIGRTLNIKLINIYILFKE